MGQLIIDSNRCNFCGICLLECPLRIIEITSPESLPSWIAEGEERCINCGHCVAVCPLAAIGLEKMKPEDCAPVIRSLLPSPEQAEHMLKSRRSIRVYKQEVVPHEVLAKLIDIARYAASAHNSQTLHWLVIEDSRKVKQLGELVADWMRVALKDMPDFANSYHLNLMVTDWERGLDRILRSAPHVVVVHAPEDSIRAPLDAPIAMTYLELAAYGLGLGACWAGWFQAAAVLYPPMAEALNLPNGHRFLGAMMIGYPKHQYARIPLKKEPSIIWC
jgi:nitroreductase/Pyruvate/2-oxoacid:ferredoxin oxidoreductase delta subunit